MTSVTTAAPRRRPRRTKLRRRQTRLAWLLLLPSLAVVALVALYPLAKTIYQSFTNQEFLALTPAKWVGFKNYETLWHDAIFRHSVWTTTKFTLITVAIEFALGLVIALVVNSSFKGRGAMRAIMLVPWAIPTVVAALLWRFIFDSQAGIANVVLTNVGLLEHPLVWFVRASTAWVPVILADVWKTTPFVALLLLAGLQSIDQELYEAAATDGASAWWQLTRITIPLLKPAILVALIFRTLDAFRVFDLIYVMTGGGPGTSTEPVALYTFNALLQNLEFGYGAALSVIIFIVTFGLAMLYMRGLGVDLGDSRGGAPRR